MKADICACSPSPKNWSTIEDSVLYEFSPEIDCKFIVRCCYASPLHKFEFMDEDDNVFVREVNERLRKVNHENFKSSIPRAIPGHLTFKETK
jgi:hypothetical protein